MGGSGVLWVRGDVGVKVRGELVGDGVEDVDVEVEVMILIGSERQCGTGTSLGVVEVMAW